jgi:hypothetical protein
MHSFLRDTSRTPCLVSFVETSLRSRQIFIPLKLSSSWPPTQSTQWLSAQRTWLHSPSSKLHGFDMNNRQAGIILSSLQQVECFVCAHFFQRTLQGCFNTTITFDKASSSTGTSKTTSRSASPSCATPSSSSSDGGYVFSPDQVDVHGSVEHIIAQAVDMAAALPRPLSSKAVTAKYMLPGEQVPGMLFSVIFNTISHICFFERYSKPRSHTICTGQCGFTR